MESVVDNDVRDPLGAATGVSFTGRPADNNGDATATPFPTGWGVDVSNAAANAAATASDAAANPLGSAAAAAMAAADGVDTKVVPDGEEGERLLTSGWGLGCSRTSVLRGADKVGEPDIEMSDGLIAHQAPRVGDPGSPRERSPGEQIASPKRGREALQPLPTDSGLGSLVGRAPMDPGTPAASSSDEVLPFPNRSCGLGPLEDKRPGKAAEDEGLPGGNGENLPSRLQLGLCPGPVALISLAGTFKFATLGDGES